MRIKDISFSDILEGVLRLGVLFSFLGFCLVFLNSNIEYFKELPTLIILGLPFGIIAVIVKLLEIRWLN